MSTAEWQNIAGLKDLYSLQQQNLFKMPENTEVLNMKDECCAPQVEKHDSGTDSDSDDSIPELEGI